MFAAVAAQAVPFIRSLPRPAPPVATDQPVQSVQGINPGQLNVKLLPDLIVTDVRIEDDQTAHFKVSNQGTADAVGPIRLSSDAYIGTRRAQQSPGGATLTANLAMGESRWIAVKGYSPIGESYYAGKDYSFPLSQATGFTAYVDAPVYGGGLWGGGDPSREFQQMFGGGGDKGPKCDATIGCIRELDETNNSFTAKGDALVKGKPE